MRRRQTSLRPTEREPRDRVAPQEPEIIESDEDAPAPDLRVGETEPSAEAERVGEENEQHDGGRQQKQQAERVAAVVQAREQRGVEASAHWSIDAIRPPEQTATSNTTPRVDRRALERRFNRGG